MELLQRGGYVNLGKQFFEVEGLSGQDGLVGWGKIET